MPAKENFDSFAATFEKDEYVKITKGFSFASSGVVPFGVLSGIPQLDLALGRDGLPAGRFVELFGFQYTGKSTLAAHFAAQAQRAGGGALWIDTEMALDESWFHKLGVDTASLEIGDVGSLEGVFRTIERRLGALIAEGGAKEDSPFIIVVDSVAMAPTEWDLGKEFVKGHRMGFEAKQIKAGVRRIVHPTAKAKANVVFVNHAIQDPGATMPKPSESGGGHAIKFVSTVRLGLNHRGELTSGSKGDTVRLGQTILVKIRKGRCSSLRKPNFEIDLLVSKGFNRAASLLTAALEAGMITESRGAYDWAGLLFTPKEWPAVLEKAGGLERAYQDFIVWAIENGKISAWGGTHDSIVEGAVDETPDL